MSTRFMRRFIKKWSQKQSIISHIIRDADKMAEEDESMNLKWKRNSYDAAPRLEKAPLKWICQKNIRGVALNGELKNIKGQKILQLATTHLAPDDKITLTLSKGWIDRFKKR